MTTAPNILEYKSAKSYFNDYFQFRQTRDGHFSYEIWSSELSYKSRSLLPMIMAGQRNISLEFVDNFSRKMNFTEKQSRHLGVLALLQQNSDSKLNAIYQESLLKTLEVDKKRRVIDGESFSSFILNPLMQVLISFKDFKATFLNIKKMIGAGEEDVKKALANLEKLQLIHRAGEEWESSVSSFEVKSTNSGLKKFHRDTQQEVLEQLEADDPAKKFRSIYFSVHPEQVENVSADIEEFLKKLRIKYGSDHLDQRRLMKVNVQSYPLSAACEKNYVHNPVIT